MLPAEERRSDRSIAHRALALVDDAPIALTPAAADGGGGDDDDGRVFVLLEVVKLMVVVAAVHLVTAVCGI